LSCPQPFFCVIVKHEYIIFLLNVKSFFEKFSFFNLLFKYPFNILAVMDAIELKIERVRRHINMQKLSGEMGKSIGWLSNFENNRVKITPKLINLYMNSLTNLENGNSTAV